jgi:hypothetical protein
MDDMKHGTTRSLIYVAAALALIMLLAGHAWSREAAGKGRLFGPVTYEKVKGEIGHFIVHVPSPPNLSSMTISVTNGDKGRKKLKNALISVNGVPVDKPSDLFSKGKSSKKFQVSPQQLNLIEIYMPDLAEEGAVVVEVVGEVAIKQK